MIFYTRFYSTFLVLLFATAANAQVAHTVHESIFDPAKGFEMHGMIGHAGGISTGIMVTSVPSEQVLKECSFFGGDSLNGFNFDKVSKQAALNGDKLYVEFKSFMRARQTEFVKKKYNIPLLPSEITAANKIFKLPFILSGPCNNLDFENGDFTGWLMQRGYNQNSNAPLTITGPANYSTDLDIYNCNDVQLINSLYGVDAIGLPGLDPTGGNFSARLGGFSINQGGTVGLCSSFHASSTHTNGEQLSQTFVIGSSNDLVSFDYAVVLNDGNHLAGVQPYFHVYVTDSVGVVLNSCTEYYVQAVSGTPPAGFVNSGYVNTYDNSVLYYKNWTSNSINLSSYIGHTVTLNFVAAGCAQQAHTAWAYIDVTCGPAQILASNPSPCSGTNITLTAPAIAGGSYSWSGPGIVGSNIGQSVVVNVSGTYMVTVIPSQGISCAYSLSQAINFIPTPTLAPSALPFSICTGNSSTLYANAINATSYVWAPGGQTTSSITITPTTGGMYTVTVTNANSCTTSNTVTFTVNSPPDLTGSSTQAGCGIANGTATANATGGTPNYTYVWSNGQTNQTATGLAGGTYTVTVIDANGCSVAAPSNIVVTSSPTVTASGTIAGCSLANGTATANSTGGAPNYTYLWDNGQSTQIVTGLAGGIYTVTVTDSNGCSDITTTNVLSTSSPIATVSATPAACSLINGTATANPTGGTAPYTYTWNNGQTNQIAIGLAGGTYTVVVKDVNGCSVVATANITATSAPTVTASGTQTGCSIANGTATANPSGGTPNYTYLWSNGQTNQIDTALAVGTYTIIISDANGCSGLTTISITNFSAPIVTISGTQAGCSVANGTATANPSGGAPNYTYLWSNGQTNQIDTALAVGTYSVLISDVNGCTISSSVTINQSPAITVASINTDVSCNGGNNGSATANVTSGTPTYNYSWNTSPVQTTSTATGLSAGTYSVNIVDANGCTVISTATIAEPLPITLSVSGTDTVCMGSEILLTANTNGGTPAYTYIWIPGYYTDPSVTVVPDSIISSYSVSVLDASGCSSLSQTFNVTLLPSSNAAFDTVSSGTFGSSFYFSDLSSGAASWLWSFGDSSSGSAEQNPIHSFPGAGTYTVTQIVFNSSGCIDTTAKIIHINEGILVPNVFTPDGDGVNDVWYIPNSGMKEFHVEIFDRWGAKVFETSADEIRWDGRSDSGKLITDGTYYFVLNAYLKSTEGTKDYSTTGYLTLLTTKK